MKALLWKDIVVGDFVKGVADDHFQLIEGTMKEADLLEYPFDFWGRVEAKSQRKIVISGAWVWQATDEDEFSDDDPKDTRGTFGIIRGGILHLDVLIPGARFHGAERMFEEG